MAKVAALLAAVTLMVLATGCGGGGAEPSASQDATLVLDFQPNAVHTGVYSALRHGYYADEGVNLHVREPSSSTDAPKLLRAGRAQFAILDIHDLGLARQQGIDVVGVAAIVQRPLAAVIARDRDAVRRPRDLEGERVGVTGLPSDDAVLDSVLESDGADPESVDRVTIGFNAVSDLRAGRLAAATGFWNAEGVALRRAGVPIRELRVDDYGAPRYPELVLATSSELAHGQPELVRSVVRATARGYRAVSSNPDRGLDDLIASTAGLDRAEQRAQLRALLAAGAFKPVASLDPDALRSWSRWDARHGVLREPIDVSTAFDERFVPGSSR